MSCLWGSFCARIPGSNLGSCHYKAYILSICDKYFKGRPDATFVKNFNAVVAEWRIGHYVNEYNKGKGEVIV